MELGAREPGMAQLKGAPNCYGFYGNRIKPSCGSIVDGFNGILGYTVHHCVRVHRYLDFRTPSCMVLLPLSGYMFSRGTDRF